MKKIIFILKSVLITTLIYSQDCLSPEYYYDECLETPPHSCLDDCDCTAGRCCSPFGWCQDANSEWCVETFCSDDEAECWDGSCVGGLGDCPEPEPGVDCSCGDGACNGNETYDSCPEDCEEDCVTAGTGDANSDGVLNVLDIVIIVGEILEPTWDSESCEFETIDANNDGELNVLDIVIILGIILDN